jgi:Holliday junction resolvase
MNSSRNKGSRIEREMVHRHLDAGIPAERVGTNLTPRITKGVSLYITTTYTTLNAREYMQVTD